MSTIADRAYEKEKELYVSPFSAKNLKLDDIPSKETETKIKDTVTKKVEKMAPIKSTKTKVSSAKKADKKLVKATKDIVDNTKTGDTLRDDVRVVFKKALTDREQKVFDYFAAHKNKIVYAKDLASLLDLPRDYVYKYIKNLRAKIEGESLKNADKGGFILSI